MLGERLFQAVQSRRLRLSLLMSWLKVDVEADDFAEFYWKLIEQLETERR